MPKLKFLVVEDDLFYQTYVNDLLAGSDVDIVNAADGEAGLAMAADEQPDLIITDIEIPKIQGFVLFKTLRQREDTKNIPVIMMSGKVEKALLERHSRMNLHADGYLVKPFNGQVLIETIRNVLGDEFGFSDVAVDPDEESAPDAERQIIAAEVPETRAAAHVKEESPGTHKADSEVTVLVVDDSKYICDVTSGFLEEFGAKVETAYDGENGYKIASDILPDLVLLDVQMPIMNGFVVCEKLRKNEKTSNIPIILMSAVVDDESFQRHSKLRYHADAYLQKPFMKSELHELVVRFTPLGERASEHVESKTGFALPTEDGDDEVAPSHDQVPFVVKRAAEELEQARKDLEAREIRESQLTTELESVTRARDQLEAEMFELRKTVEGDEGSLKDKLKLVTQRYEETRSLAQQLAEENSELQNRLESESTAAQDRGRIEGLERDLNETREALEAREQEIQDLQQRVREVGAGEELKEQLNELSARLQQASADTLDLENRNRLLNDEIRALKQEQESVDADSPGREEEMEDLLQEVDALKRDLAAALAAKQEIEDQAKILLEKGQGGDEEARLENELEKSREENQELITRISEAESRLRELDELQSLFDEVQTELEEERSEKEEIRKELSETSDGNQEELDELRERLSAALKRANSLEEEKQELSESANVMEKLQSRISELEKTNEDLKKAEKKMRQEVAAETGSLQDLEEQLRTLGEEKTRIEEELGEVRKQLTDSEKAGDRIASLENRLEVEKKLRSDAEDEILTLKKKLDNLSETGELNQELEKDNSELKAALKKSRNRCKELEQNLVRERADGTKGKGSSEPDLEGRLGKLEDALERTVREAQNILKEQQNRETELEGNVDSLMRSLAEERDAFRRERQEWASREGELKETVEDALKENRRMLNEEAARLYPMHIPRYTRPLEVVSRGRQYGFAAAVIVAAVILFMGGYFINSRLSSPAVTPIVPAREAAVEELAKLPENLPELWINRSGPGESYEDLWRRNTIQSVSDDMLIQATLHTRDELEAAINYSAAKEGWTNERKLQAMKDMTGTYNLSGSYYVTVYSKNLKGGYPGFADSFERHIALRDQSGREVRARLPQELEGSKFITSRVSAAGKEMNPVFLYEVGLTVAFSRQQLTGKPEGLQLVLYDIGAVPIRVLTWDMSALGSFSFYGSGEKPVVDS